MKNLPAGRVTFLLSDLGKPAIEQGDDQCAVSHYKEFLSLAWNWGIDRKIADGLEQLASAVMYQHLKEAVRLLGTAEALRQSGGVPIFPYQIADYERTLKLLRTRVNEATFAACWAEGLAMNVQQAVQCALGQNP
jgi:hypothetical protein